MHPEWRAEVPNLDLLNRLVAEPLPLGIRSDPVEPFFQRDVYFDAPDWSLRRRGVTCRFRVRVDDRRLLTLRTIVPGEGGPAIAPLSFESEVPELDGAQALAGTSDPARRLRAMIEPSRLVPRIQFETERRVRRTRPGWLKRARYEMVYDVVTVRSGDKAQQFQELKIRQLRAGRPSLEEVSRVFVERYGLRPLLVGKVDRAEKLVRDMESAVLAGAARGVREVAALVLSDESIALISDEGTLRLPVMGGSGEAACRTLLRTEFGSSDGQVRLLGTAPAGGTRPLLEVWLARRVPRIAAGGRLRWLPFHEVIALAGAPGLRDPRTLAALTVAARSEATTEWIREPAAQAAAPSDRRPAERRRRARVSEVALRLPSAAVDGKGTAPGDFLNADLSTLEFNARVLALAEDERVPLLARIRFLGIFSANLDEFFMVRVGTLKRAASASSAAGEDGLTPAEQLDAVAVRVRALLERQSRCLSDLCEPALRHHGVRIFGWAELEETQRQALRRYFEEQLFPLTTPQAITRAPGHPFPLVPNLRLSLAIVVHDPRSGGTHFAYLKVPDSVQRFVPVPGGVIPVEDVLRANLSALYPGREVHAAYAFRVTRAADLELDEHHAASLLQAIGEETRRRPYGAPVRLEVERAMPASLRELVERELQFEDRAPDAELVPGDVYEIDGLLDLSALRELARLPLPGLDYPPHQGGDPIPPGISLLELLEARDLLVYHPFDDFGKTVERLFIEAADDPAVVAIKLTLYRAGGRSGIVDALRRAAAAGKEVFVFVELKARFDEERNIEWARTLEQAGIRVVYGFVDLKTHAKAALIIRREPEGGGVRRYVHIGTGNYNAATAALYTDLGLLSSDPELGADLHDFFNELSGSSQAPGAPYRRILVSPTFLLPRMIELIEREAAHARQGREGRIRVKLNGLADPDVIAALYRASAAGVRIDLLVRGVCTLRPGVPGLSENIRVFSILGRFLEHARIFAFANAGDPEYFIGSADWRPRNLRKRVEVVAPVRDPESRRRLDRILDAQVADPDAWLLQPDGSYMRSGDAGDPGAHPTSAAAAAIPHTNEIRFAPVREGSK
jgi:polyphosphate kinase